MTTVKEDALSIMNDNFVTISATSSELQLLQTIERCQSKCPVTTRVMSYKNFILIPGKHLVE